MNIVEPRVELIAHTSLACNGRSPVIENYMSLDPDAGDAQQLVEFSGRSCYQSFHKPNPKTARNKDYIARTLHEQGHHCYSEDTDVLTWDGWKSWSEVSMDDKFATLNPEGEIEYHYPTEIIEEHYAGDMIEYVGRGANLMVTPNHKMLACLTTTVAGRKKDRFSLIPADQLVGVSHAMRKDGDFTGGEGTLGESLAWMYGFFAGDGSIQPKWDNQIEFHMSKQRKISRLTEAVADLGWEMAIRPEKNREGTSHYAVMVPKHLVETFREFYSEDGQKQIPQRIVLQATKAEARAIIQGMVDSDGSVCNESGSGIVFDSSSETLRDQFMQLALHAGWAANEVEGSTHLAGTVNIINGFEAVLKNDCKRICLLKERLRPEFNKKATAHKSTNRVTKYVGKVYCATVPNHTLYVRRNGKPVWSGNSIAEHATATFYITGVSRALTHELIRHRHLSYSQLSQRFVDEEDANIVVPPAVRNAKGINEPYYDEELGGGVIGATENLKVMGGLAIATYAGLVEELQEVEGLSRKQAREAARAVLPNMIETRIVVTGNMRAWHEVIERRTAPDADAEFQQVAGMIRDELKKLAPAIFTD